MRVWGGRGGSTLGECLEGRWRDAVNERNRVASIEQLTLQKT